MIIHQKIKAQALQFALLISVLVGLILGAFILLTHVQSFFKVKANQVIQNTELLNRQILSIKELPKVTNDTLVRGIDRAQQKLIIDYYGAWLRVNNKIIQNNQVLQKQALIGSQIQDDTPNLYVVDNNAPIVVVGDTRIQGNNYIPEQGIKAGNISGNYYQGSQLYFGNIKKSNKELPNLKKDWIAYLDRISDQYILPNSEMIELSNTIKNSFQNATQQVFDEGPIFITNQTIIGNVIIKSNQKITVYPTAQLMDVVLVAPKIELLDRVKGSMQIIASKEVKIGKGCHLSYPSAAVLYDQKQASNSNIDRTVDFIIKSNSLIEGSVVYLKKNDNQINRIRTNIKLDQNTMIIGDLYCKGNVDFQGIVEGSLYTQQFIADQSGSRYLNHIYNGKIIPNRIPKYSGLPLENSKTSIAKWLY